MKAVVVIMGVSGSGKSVVGALLAHRLAVPFREGDELHPAANIAKMQAGLPLDQASEIAKLRRELDRARMERDILKKAVIYLANTDGLGHKLSIRS